MPKGGRSLQRERAARARQEAQMKNLARGAQEQAAAAAAAGQSTGNVNDPKGQVKAVASGFNVSVLSAGAPSTAQRSNRQGGAFKTGGNQFVKKVSPSQPNNPGVRVTNSPSRQSIVAPTARPNPVMPQGYGMAKQVPTQHTPQELVKPQSYEPSHTPVEQMRQEPSVRREDVTVIISLFERPAYLRRQLQALYNQTVQPMELVLWANAGEVAQDAKVLSSVPGTVVRSNTNHGAWPRFREGLAAKSMYVCLLDDDTLPGPRWLEAAINRIRIAEQDPEGGPICVAAMGEIFRTDNPDDRMILGPQSPRDEEMEVDIGRQGWVFNRELLRAVVANPSFGDGRHGWEFHLAACLQMQNVLTVVLPYEQGNTEQWGMLEPPTLERSLSWRFQIESGRGGKDATFRRREIYAAYRQIGWAPIVAQLAEPEESTG